jgi:very-short-patch-repair endonuclease
MPSEVVLKARELRKNQTPEEKEFWHFLRDKRFAGFKFRRQHPIGHYIADFCCPERKLVIELDGAGHDFQYDQIRDEYLASRKFKVFRISNEAVRKDRDRVLLQLLRLLGS